MKPAAQHAAEIIIHYLDRGGCVDIADRFGEIESAMQGMIDEARATFRLRPDGSMLRLKNPVPHVHLQQGPSKQAPQPIEIPDAPRTIPGPSCLLDGTVEEEE